MIHISKPDIGPAEEEAVLDVLRSGMLAMGKKTAAFEEAWAAYCGVEHAVLMSNGTVALEAILRALGIGPGDEVITVSFTFNATVSTIIQAGATPVFVDIRADDFCMDPDLVEAAITPRTKAILPVHLYGLMADMDPLVAIAQRHNIAIVEDAAQAHGATYRGRRAGRFGPAMFSLYATKNLMTGEGGFATTDDDDLADRLRLYRNHGMRVRYHHDELGSNFKPTDLAAAIGLAQLGRLDERTEQRRRNAARLTEGLAWLPRPRRARWPRPRLAPVHDALPRRARRRGRRPHGAGHRDADLLPRSGAQAVVRAGVSAGRRRPRPPGHQPALRRGPLDPGPPEPGRRGARSRDRRDPRGRDARRPGRGARACRPDRRGAA